MLKFYHRIYETCKGTASVNSTKEKSRPPKFFVFIPVVGISIIYKYFKDTIPFKKKKKNNIAAKFPLNKKYQQSDRYMKI